MIDIHEAKEDGGVTVYATVMGERTNLARFGARQTTTIRAFKAGAYALATNIQTMATQMTPEKVAEVAQEAARAAGVDESIIAQGGVAVGPWGSREVHWDDDESEEPDTLD